MVLWSLVCDEWTFHHSGTYWKTLQEWIVKGWLSMFERPKSNIPRYTFYCISKSQSTCCSFNEIKTYINLGSTSRIWWWIFKVHSLFSHVQVLVIWLLLLMRSIYISISVNPLIFLYMPIIIVLYFHTMCGLNMGPALLSGVSLHLLEQPTTKLW